MSTRGNERRRARHNAARGRWQPHRSADNPPNQGDAMTINPIAADGRSLVLADGNHMPPLGLGVWQVPLGPECVSAVRWALELGYRHIDTAQAYGNEESVGQALRDSDVPRQEVFITTKFYPGGKDPGERGGLRLRVGIRGRPRARRPRRDRRHQPRPGTPLVVTSPGQRPVSGRDHR